MFDVISFLEENDFEFLTSGKNVSSGWVGINCPFCSDPSQHLGINLSSGIYHCWICGAKGGSESLVKRLLNVSYGEAKRIVEEYDSNQILNEDQEKTFVKKIEFPKGCLDKLPAIHREYLIHRKFDPDYLSEKYRLKACLYTGGDFAYRLIIPIIMDNHIVAYTGRDVTNEQKIRYKHSKNEQSIVAVKDCIYNIDTVENRVIIVEGVTDVWRIGDGCVALFGLEHTTRQLNALFSRNLDEAFVMFDSEPHAIKKAYRLANILSTFIPTVQVLELDQGDPAEMSDPDVEKLKEILKWG